MRAINAMFGLALCTVPSLCAAEPRKPGRIIVPGASGQSAGRLKACPTLPATLARFIQMQDAALHREHDCLGAIFGAQLPQNRLDVCLDRAYR